MSYRNGLNYLESKTKVLELYNRFGARVAVCPEWNGRVMTSTGDGLDGTSYGLIHVAAIDAAQVGPAFCFFGGEDQLTLSPKGGPFSLYYETEAAGFSSARDHPHPPHGYREGPFVVDTAPPDPQIRMRRTVQMTNLAGALFDFDIVRTVRLLEHGDIERFLGHPVAVSLEQSDVSFVGFETTNSLHNRGQPLVRESGLVSLRIRSMFNSGQNTVVIVPFRIGDAVELGPTVCADFLGASPHGRLRVLPQAALLRADSKYRCQIGVSRRRALPILGSVDFRTGLLTLTTFNLPTKPWQRDYPCNDYCETTGNAVVDFVSAREYFLAESTATASDENDGEIVLERSPEDTPYSGEVVRVYNHGPAHPGEQPTAQFYEFNVFSPATELNRGESLTHHQFTAHINADNQTLAYLVRTILGVEYERVYEKMIH